MQKILSLLSATIILIMAGFYFLLYTPTAEAIICDPNFGPCPPGSCDPNFGPCPDDSSGTTNPTPGTTNPTSSGQPVTLPNPIGQSDPRVIIGMVIRVALGLVGSLALLLFVYGGFIWMTSSGNTERIKHGRDTLVWSTIGLIVIFASYTIVNFIIQSIPK